MTDAPKIKKRPVTNRTIIEHEMDELRNVAKALNGTATAEANAAAEALDWVLNGGIGPSPHMRIMLEASNRQQPK